MFSGENNLKNLIIEILGQGQMSTINLIEKAKARRSGTTKQGIYKILKSLKEDETIILNKKEVALSSLWLKKLSDFAEMARKSYSQNREARQSFLSLQEGEKISYSFKTFEDTDRFWIHAFDLLSDFTTQRLPVLIYNPHEWFLLARNESETDLFKRLVKSGRSLLSLTAEKDPLDVYVKKYFDNKFLQYYNLGSYPFRSSYNVNVFDDFLIEVNLDQGITDKIDAVYKKYTEFSPVVREELIKIIRSRGKNKLIISRNHKKAETIRKLFKKFFA